MEIQIHGMTSATEGFELKLRAAGASEATRFKHQESVWSIPSTVSGAVSGKIRLILNLDSEEETWTMLHEAEISKDKEDLIKAVSVDQIALTGEADVVLKHLGFVQDFQIGRNGSRVVLPAGWVIEYFGLFEPKSQKSKSGSSSQNPKQQIFSVESGAQGWLVTIGKKFQKEEEIPNLFAEGLKIIRRLSPEFQAVTCSSIESSD